jgi:hypothetical protein
LSGPWECVLNAFVAGDPAQLDISIEGRDGDDGPCGYNDHIVLLGDGTALMTRFRNGPEPMRRVVVKVEEVFDACLANGTPEGVAPCLTDWFDAEICADIECCVEEHVLAGPPVCE